MHLLHVAGGHEESQAVTNTCKRANGDVLGIACQMLSLPVWFFNRGRAILLGPQQCLLDLHHATDCFLFQCHHLMLPLTPTLLT
jgi:hypothetical protein